MDECDEVYEMYMKHNELNRKYHTPVNTTIKSVRDLEDLLKEVRKRG